jgi:hypothetical protein
LPRENVIYELQNFLLKPNQLICLRHVISEKKFNNVDARNIWAFTASASAVPRQESWQKPSPTRWCQCYKAFYFVTDEGEI